MYCITRWLAALAAAQRVVAVPVVVIASYNFSLARSEALVPVAIIHADTVVTAVVLMIVTGRHGALGTAPLASASAAVSIADSLAGAVLAAVVVMVVTGRHGALGAAPLASALTRVSTGCILAGAVLAAVVVNQTVRALL